MDDPQLYGIVRTVDSRDFVSHPQVGIESSFGNIAVHMDQRILVALALDTALALGKVSRTPVSYTHLDVYKRQVQ